MSRLDELNSRVTSAIFALEEAARKVSRLEEEIAALTPSASAEGIIARRGAVRAALIAGDTERAKELLGLFKNRDGLDLEGFAILVPGFVSGG